MEKKSNKAVVQGAGILVSIILLFFYNSIMTSLYPSSQAPLIFLFPFVIILIVSLLLIFKFDILKRFYREKEAPYSLNTNDTYVNIEPDIKIIQPAPYSHEQYYKTRRIEGPYFASLEKSRQLYSVVYNSRDYYSSNAIDLIKRSEWEVNYFQKWKREYEHAFKGIKHVPALYHLARVYEWRENYVAAIEICDFAIKNNLSDDGTKGGFPGRYERMKRKLKNQNK